MEPSPRLQKIIQEKLSGTAPNPSCNFLPIGGGSINKTYRIETAEETLFCKINSATAFPDMLQTEKAGLELLAAQRVFRTPAIRDCFESEDQQVLLLEWIEPGERTRDFWISFGKQLAALHQVSSGNFGLDHHNYMGSIPQSNQPHKTWIDFFARERLRPMMKRCFNKKLLSKAHCKQFEMIEGKLNQFFKKQNPSLLHGDLWAGNFLCDKNGQPVLIDPAVYFGHRSVDLAMTTLFGGFQQPFYDSYNYHFPLPANYREQWDICNLYPLLIHLDLFGTQYLPQIERTLSRYS